jgi:hypothetical protein
VAAVQAGRGRPCITSIMSPPRAVTSARKIAARSMSIDRGGTSTAIAWASSTWQFTVWSAEADEILPADVCGPARSAVE